MSDEKIRKRKSYIEFANWLEFLVTKPSKKQILYKLYSTIDSRRGYGTKTKSDWARESLLLLVKDKDLI